MNTYLFIAAYIIGFIINWGGFYSYFCNKYPTLDSPSNRREDLAAAIMWAIFTPIASFVTPFSTGFFFYGLQWWGGPRAKYAKVLPFVRK